MEGACTVVLHSTGTAQLQCLAQTPGERAIYMALQTSADRELGCEQQTAPSSLLRTIIFTSDPTAP